MTTGTQFIRGSNPVWYFVDLVGKQTDGSFYLWTLTNTIPYIPQAVYHDINGLIPWTDPIEFLANGTLPIDIFYDDSKVYRLEIRKNDGTAPPSQADALIYLIENYIPGNSMSFTPVSAENNSTENQISNPQFSVVNFDQPITFTNVTQNIEIAPGWTLELNGIGGITVTKVPLNIAQSNPTNAPYALKFDITGPWTNSPRLRQRFQQNGMNWAGKTIASSFTGLSTAAVQPIVVRLVASDGAPLATLQTSTLTTNFAQYQGFATLPASTNPNIPPDAYIDYQLILPASGTVYLTSMQIVVSDVAANVSYQQDTIDRQLDHLSHYYKPQLEYKPIPSYLVGWDFAKNPAQILGDTVGAQATGANKSFYAWDQTIVFQTLSNGVTVSRDAAGGGLKLTAALAGQFAILQYLEMAQVRDLLQGRMAVYINALTNNLNGYFANVSLWVNNTDVNLPNVATGTNNSAITALSALGKPTMGNGTWTEIPRSNFGDTKFLVSAPPTDFYEHGWSLGTATIADDAKWFAIVIGFEPIAQNDTITIQSVGLCAGDMATRPAPKTLDETLRDCERYYEKSYIPSDIPGTAVTTFNSLSASMNSTVPFGGGNQCFILESPFTIEYRTQKRIPATQGFPTVNIYPTSAATVNNVSIYTVIAAVVALNGLDPIATWGDKFIGDKFATFAPTTNNAAITANGFNATTPVLFYARYHYVADARLGIVN